MKQKSHDITPKNTDLEILKTHFPQCFTKEGAFDFEKFKAEIAPTGENLSRESYGLHWLGKSYARLLATDKTTTFLTEDTAHNHLPENQNAENLLIKGDNLEVLKHLSNAYHSKIKMIYIDPPYNTGSDGFVYQDNRKFTAEQLQKLAGIEDYEAERILEFTQSKSNSHSAWLTFMYPRLYIAKRLLTDDGVIFISIDDNEVAQLRLLCDEIFGEENFVGQFIRRSINSGKHDSTTVSVYHEYLLSYSKNTSDVNLNRKAKTEEERLKLYPLKDEYFSTRGRYYISQLDKGSIQYSDSLNYPIEAPDGTQIWAGKGFNDKSRVFRWSKEKVKWGIENDFIVFKKQKDKWKVYAKSYEFRDNNNIEIEPSNPYTTLDYISKDFSNFNATPELQKIFNGISVFDFPKPVIFIKDIIKYASKKEDIILDFFAGSGTTADAVMQLNREDGGNRKFILVQLPEPIDPKKSKTAYDFVKNELGVAEPTIFDITKERIIRSSTAVSDKPKKEELFSEEKPIATTGFKIFATTPIWEDYEKDYENFDPQLELFDPEYLTEENIATLLTTWKTYDGIPLTSDLEKVDLGGYTAYYKDEKLYLMSKGFSTENLKSLVEKIDHDTHFNPLSVVAFGHYFESKALRELSENLKNYNNKKQSEENISVVVRY